MSTRPAASPTSAASPVGDLTDALDEAVGTTLEETLAAAGMSGPEPSYPCLPQNTLSRSASASRAGPNRTSAAESATAPRLTHRRSGPSTTRRAATSRADTEAPRCATTAASTRRSQTRIIREASRRARGRYQARRARRPLQYVSDSTPSDRSGGASRRASNSSSGESDLVCMGPMVAGRRREAGP